jgi:hypothetical protein
LERQRIATSEISWRQSVNAKKNPLSSTASHARLFRVSHVESGAPKGKSPTPEPHRVDGHYYLAQFDSAPPWSKSEANCEPYKAPAAGYRKDRVTDRH